jgi:hypothetical protein
MNPPCKRHELAGMTDECFCPDRQLPPPPSDARPVLWGLAGYTSLGALIDNESDMDD